MRRPTMSLVKSRVQRRPKKSSLLGAISIRGTSLREHTMTVRLCSIDCVIRVLKEASVINRVTPFVACFSPTRKMAPGAAAYSTAALEKKESQGARTETWTTRFSTARIQPRKSWFTMRMNSLRAGPRSSSPYGITGFQKSVMAVQTSVCCWRTAPLWPVSIPDSQRYFDYYHHTAIDSLDKVNRRELNLWRRSHGGPRVFGGPARPVTPFIPAMTVHCF